MGTFAAAIYSACRTLFRENPGPQYFFYSNSCVIVLVSYLCGPQSAVLPRGNGNIAQLVEHSTENAGVVGSIPTVATETPVCKLQTGVLLLAQFAWKRNELIPLAAAFVRVVTVRIKPGTDCAGPTHLWQSHLAKVDATRWRCHINARNTGMARLAPSLISTDSSKGFCLKLHDKPDGGHYQRVFIEQEDGHGVSAVGAQGLAVGGGVAGVVGGALEGVGGRRGRLGE